VMDALRFSGLFDETDLALVARSLSKYKFGVWRPMGRLLGLSGELSIREGLTVYDACYVALAQRIGVKVITEDKELLQKFPAHTVSVRHYASQS
jgi:predicted nucleic acid-binding protein